MPKYVIERAIPGAGNYTPEQLKDISEVSRCVLRDLGPEIIWLYSYVAKEKIYCVYIAPNEDLIREHAVRAGFPADSVMEVSAIIDPATAE